MPNRRALLTLLAAAALGACGSPPAFAVGGIVDLQIVARARGEALPTYRSRGATWVAGRPGDRYAVRLSNRSGGRVLVVLSVDGVNAVSGETAATGQTGYVLGPWQSTEITGWRKSWSEAAAFYFTALPDSYAARTGRPDNVGVIGAAVFRERVEQPVQRSFQAPPVARGRFDAGEGASAERRAEAADGANSGSVAAPAAASPQPREPESLAKTDKLGTGHGEREYSPTTQTTFERAGSQPDEIVQVRYDSWANLVAAGVVARPRPPAVPDPFPAFVPDPR